MSVSIRLSRGGRKNNPLYRVVAMDSRKAATARCIEVLGTYNPKLDAKEGLKLKKDSYDHWVKVGAQASTRIANLVAELA